MRALIIPISQTYRTKNFMLSILILVSEYSSLKTLRSRKNWFHWLPRFISIL
jgi:hypothetical protein